jgi:hypothetical protein
MRHAGRAREIAKIGEGEGPVGKPRKNKETAELDKIIEEITTDAYGEDECYVAFLTVLEDELGKGCEAKVMGEDVTVVGWDYRNERLGVIAKCRKKDREKHEVAAWEVEVAAGTHGEKSLAAYRRWLGMESNKRTKTDTGKGTERKGGVRKVIELAVLAVRDKALDCRVLGEEDGREIIFRAAVKGVVPGEIVRVVPEKRWVYGGQESIDGQIKGARIEVAALGLEPLKLRPEGTWNPKEMDWGEEGPTVEEWTKMLPVNARGKRPQYEMEQVVPGANFAGEIDPIMEANELKDNGDAKGARKVLMELCRQDLRCLDAHAHLGNMVFKREPETAVKHYEVGVRIGELTLGEGFDGVLPWGLIDNRPFMRCMDGYGIALWRLRKFREAEEIFRQMLMLNPPDNQGVRFLIDKVAKKELWREDMY